MGGSLAGKKELVDRFSFLSDKRCGNSVGGRGGGFCVVLFRLLFWLRSFV